MSSLSIPEPSLSSRAMLCSLSISMWSARIHDQAVSEEIATLHRASVNAGRYNKLLLPKTALEEIQKIAQEARQEHYFMTLPWGDDGYRVLPAAAYMDHTEKMRMYANRFGPAVDALVSKFEEFVAQAKNQLGTMFQPSDYPGIREDREKLTMPAPNELRAKFSFETKVMPLPDAADFRVSLGDEEKMRIQRQITATVEASLQVASRDLWQRLFDAVSHLAERLKAYKVTTEGVEHPFRDSVVTNLVKIVDILPKLNVTGDPALETLASEVRVALLVDPKELRTSDAARVETARAAEAIAQRMAGYMTGYGIPAATRSEAA